LAALTGLASVLTGLTFWQSLVVGHFALAGILAISIALLTVSFQSVKAATMNPVTSLRSE